MGGLFGTISKEDCVTDLFYGTDYHSHLGTKRGGLAVKNASEIKRSIHNIERDYFRSKFESDLPDLHGNMGIGIISDHDDQPLIINSHLGTFAIVTVCKINNIAELTQKALGRKIHFAEMGSGETNPTELVAMLICEQDSFEAGIHNAQHAIKGSCSMLLLTKDESMPPEISWVAPRLLSEKKTVHLQHHRKPAPFRISAMKLRNTWVPVK